MSARPSAPLTRSRHRWLAWRDGIAHAVPARGRLTRTACGLPASDERLTWPERSRCAGCLAALGFLPAGDAVAGATPTPTESEP